MFVRKKVNKSGSVSVQVVDKSQGYKVVKSVGASKNPEEIKLLMAKAKHFIQTCGGKQTELFSFETEEQLAIRNFLSGISNTQIHTIGPELIFGTLFDRLGFGIIKEKLFRHITIARPAYPTSKLKKAKTPNYARTLGGAKWLSHWLQYF